MAVAHEIAVLGIPPRPARFQASAVLQRTDLRRLPKVELHRHLEGSIRYRTARDLLGPLRARQHHFIAGEHRSWSSFLGKFEAYRDARFSRSEVERIAREAVEDAARDGIVHLELRFSPVFFARRMPGVRPPDAACWIVGAALAEARRHRMGIRFLATLRRDLGPAINAPSVDAAVSLRPWFVGIDVAGDERRAPDLRSFSGLFRRGRQAGLRLSIHAGEIGDARNVRTAILKWGADRIGHGVRAHRDRSVLRLALRRRVPFEMCLTSNRDTGAWRRPETHPIARLVREGLRVTLNTDDPAASAIDLTHECRLAVTALGLGPREILRLQANAAESAFLEESDRRRLLSRIDPLLFGFPTL